MIFFLTITVRVAVYNNGKRAYLNSNHIYRITMMFIELNRRMYGYNRGYKHPLHLAKKSTSNRRIDLNKDKLKN